MKKLISLFIFFSLVISSFAQELSVKSFSESSTDLTARTNPHKDLNGDDCALIKVQLPMKDVVFEGMVVGVPEFKTNEYWVYMAAGSKHLSVKAVGCHTLNISFVDYSIKELVGKQTYLLTVALKKGELMYQNLTINYSPKEAVIFVDNEFQDDMTGSVDMKLPVGHHSYQVAAKGYYMQSGEINLSANNPASVDVNLKTNPNMKVVPTGKKEFVIDGDSKLPFLFTNIDYNGILQNYPNILTEYLDVSDCDEAILSSAASNGYKACIRTYDKCYNLLNYIIETESDTHIDLHNISYLKIHLWDKPSGINSSQWKLILKGNSVSWRDKKYTDPQHLVFDDSSCILDNSTKLRINAGNSYSYGSDSTIEWVDGDGCRISDFIDASNYNSATLEMLSPFNMQITQYDVNKKIIVGSTKGVVNSKTAKEDEKTPTTVDVNIRQANYIRIVFWDCGYKFDVDPNAISWRVILKK